MCYSFESSYYNWILTLFLSGYLVYKHQNNKSVSTYLWISFFALTFSQIQIIESLMWNNLSTAYSIAKFIVPLLWLQPLIQSFMGYNATNEQILLLLSIMYLIIFIHQTYLAFNKSSFNINIGQTGHLVWNRYNVNNNKIDILGSGLLSLIYLFGMIFPLFFMENKKLKISLIIYGIISFLYCYNKYNKTQEMGSIWCYMAVGYILIAVLFSETSDDNL
jgi:hypothetical protein